MPRRLTMLLALFALASAASAAPAQAAKAPKGFFGVAADGPAIGADGSLGAEGRRMRRSGVRTIRVAARWFQLEPAEGQLELDHLDETVLSAAAAGITVMPTVHTTPGWAADNGLGGEGAVPRDPSTYARFLTALVARYGPQGSLWSEHPDVPRYPIRTWQVWNEPAVRFYWEPKDWEVGYTVLLRASYAALKRADPKSTVVLAGNPGDSWEYMRDLYGQGARPYFDVAAVHPYTASVDGVLQILTLNRRAMAENGDAKKQLMITEMTFSSAKKRAIQQFTWDTTEVGQAFIVRALLPAIAQQRKPQRLAAAYWYTWASDDRKTISSFDFSGLYRVGRKGRIVAKPAARAFQESVRDLTRR